MNVIRLRSIRRCYHSRLCPASWISLLSKNPCSVSPFREVSMIHDHFFQENGLFTVCNYNREITVNACRDYRSIFSLLKPRNVFGIQPWSLCTPSQRFLANTCVSFSYTVRRSSLVAGRISSFLASISGDRLSTRISDAGVSFRLIKNVNTRSLKPTIGDMEWNWLVSACSSLPGKCRLDPMCRRIPVIVSRRWSVPSAWRRNSCIFPWFFSSTVSHSFSTYAPSKRYEVNECRWLWINVSVQSTNQLIDTLCLDRTG